MKQMLKLVCAAAVLVPAMMAAPTASAKDAAAGPKAGSYLPPFTVEKIAGAEDDGVKAGQSLCYRCKNGSSPQVVIFTRSTDGKVAELVKKLDQAVTKYQDENLKVFVNVLDKDESSAKQKAEKMASATGAKNVPFVVPSDYATGPKGYRLGDAPVIITMANDSTVKGNIAGEADSIDVDSILQKVAAML